MPCRIGILRAHVDLLYVGSMGRWEDGKVGRLYRIVFVFVFILDDDDGGMSS